MKLKRRLLTLTNLHQETESIREQPAPKTNNLAQQDLGGTSLSKEPVQGSPKQNQMGIGINMSQVTDNLCNMQVEERTRDPSISANPILFWGDNASAPNKEIRSQSGSPAKDQGTMLTAKFSQGASRQWDEAEIKTAYNHNSNWGGESPKGGRSVIENSTEPAWGGAGQTSSWGNEEQAQTSEASYHEAANSSWGNERQVNDGDGGWNNTESEQNQGVAW